MVSNDLSTDLNVLCGASRIGECVAWHSQRQPDQEAAVHNDTRISYGELEQASETWAKALLAAGVQKGDRIAMLAPGCIEWLAVLVGATDIGAIWTGFHPRYRLREFQHVTGLSEPVVLVAFRHLHGRDYVDELTSLREQNPSIRSLVLLDDELPGSVPVNEFLSKAGNIPDSTLASARDAVTADDTAVLIFTSGTTGQPKAAMVRHRALLTGAAVQLQHWPMTRPRVLHMMPVNHIAGIGMTAVFGLYAGGTLVFQDRFDPGDLIRLLETERIDHVLGSPVQFHMMANHPDLECHNLSRLKYLTWGGAPMAESLVERLEKLSCELRTSFGMTELGLYVSYSDAGASRALLSRTIGKLHAGFDIRVADENGKIAHAGEQGEIQARGSWLLAGYYRDEQATRDAYTPDGWFRTGDVVKVLDDGNLEIVGRTKEMFISGGFNIYPREIEIVLEENPEVGLVAVLGVADPVFGEVGHAFVEPLPGTQVEEELLRNWCRDRLANYKIPKTFEVCNELPRLPIGKIDKQALRKELAARETAVSP